MENKVRIMLAFMLLGVPVVMMLALIFTQPNITAQVVTEAQSPNNADALLLWKIILTAALVVVAFFLYEKSINFQEKLQNRLHKLYNVVPLLIRFGLGMSFIVMVANGFFGTMSIDSYFLSYTAVGISVLLLFGLFTHFAAFIGLLVYLFSITQTGLTGINDLSILGGLVYLLYLKRNHFSFDDIITRNRIDIDYNAPLTVLRVFQGLALITLVYIAGYPFLFVLLGVFIILGFMLRLSEFVVILVAIVNVLYHNVDATVAMILLSAVALFISGYTLHSLDFLLFHQKKKVDVMNKEEEPIVRVRTHSARAPTRKAPQKKVATRRTKSSGAQRTKGSSAPEMKSLSVPKKKTSLSKKKTVKRKAPAKKKRARR